MRNLIQTIIWKGDWPSRFLFMAIAGSAIWCALLPFSKFVQRAYLDRFHLQTPSFASWAAQQLTPAMYNLENTFWYSERPLSMERRNTISQAYFRDLDGRRQKKSTASATAAQVQVGMVNHFPTRTMTFADARRFSVGYYYFRSRYRDTQIDSAFRLDPVYKDESTVKRMEAVIE